MQCAASISSDLDRSLTEGGGRIETRITECKCNEADKAELNQLRLIEAMAGLGRAPYRRPHAVAGDGRNKSK